MSTSNAPGFVSGLKAFFDNPLYSDLTLMCGGEEFKVHRMLLHEQSPVFRKMLNGGFVVSHAPSAARTCDSADIKQESVTNQKVINVLDDPSVFRTFLKYLYTGQYDDTARGEMAPPEFAISIYAIADKYDFEPLRKAAARKLDETCDPKNNSNDFIAAIYAIEANTAPHDISLWNVVIPKIKANISALLQSPDFMQMATLDIPDLAAALFQSLDQSSAVVFRSRAIALPKISDNNVSKVKEESNVEDEEMSDMEQPAPGRRQPRNGPYRGHGRRLGDA
ncbi:uncharacterized protein RCC_11357 [Ramularia collo-cygni]|uniref:BTB domain-containing protein n=1 Tax=Ramularia collo-cygni TaxID=112498 RepID=A0A2D3VBZ5_9PEZI|nr:uncharacterized protein RCC_11357 [Ramularia collo-cygni]CZT25688.1 uncharacterized protein RCC_11357 [Ramularia collo-cygni]